MNTQDLREELEDWLESQPEGESLSVEELQLATPNSSLEDWVYILVGQVLSGRSRYKGPPGLLTQVESLLASCTEPEMISMFLERNIPIKSIEAGLAAAFQAAHGQGT